ncbi:hypothetical protein EIN_229540 [Entamoeba invadens IP1]|uniref:SMP-LTD domain-containing protein n=1 Tax=Entamoeba invadens IP1 TaxID=370355 RepID=A0A0A1U2Y0_ENTIV|nr:hypothetical protein EIN_229540 [Entamoeba invadens IP1]ELP88421.1 hypothetical protein EIN_229540 [Entamoeba invadens IP1]|eukprot:XP_004255192.1 hypothetical protein EIN_229540 [Entamoeba invadens IP1]
MIVFLLEVVLGFVVGVILSLVISFFLVFKKKPKATPLVPEVTPLSFPPTNQAPTFPNNWFEQVPLGEVSSMCIIQTQIEETSAVISTEGKHINLVVTNQLYQIQLSDVEIENVSFCGRKLSKKNFLRVKGSKKIYKNESTVQIRFRYGYEVEYWFKLFEELVDMAHNRRARKNTVNGLGRKQFRALQELISLKGTELDLREKHWASTVNMIFQVFAYPFISNAELNQKIRDKFNAILEKEVWKGLKVSGLRTGKTAPFIKKPKIQCDDSCGGILVDGNIECIGPYGGGLLIDLNIFGITMSINFDFNKIEGQVRVQMLQIPSSTLWISFHELPTFELNYEIRIGQYVMEKNELFDQYFYFAICKIVLDQCYFPKMFPVLIPSFSLVEYFTKSEELYDLGKEEKVEIKKDTQPPPLPQKTKNFEKVEVHSTEVTSENKELQKDAITNSDVIENHDNHHVDTIETKEEELVQLSNEEKEKQKVVELKTVDSPTEENGDKIEQVETKEHGGGELLPISQNEQIQQNTHKEIEKTPISNTLIKEGKVRLPLCPPLDKTIEPYKENIELFFDTTMALRCVESYKNAQLTYSQRQKPTLPKKMIPPPKEPPMLPKKSEELVRSLQNPKLEPPKRSPPALPKKMNESEFKERPPLPPKEKEMTTSTKPKPPLPPKIQEML